MGLDRVMRAMVIAALTIGLLVHQARAQAACAAADQIASRLQQRYGELQVFWGLSMESQVVMAIWVNPSSQSWTAVFRYPNGTACVVSVGQVFELFEPPSGEPS